MTCCKLFLSAGRFSLREVLSGTVKTVPYHYYSFYGRKLSLKEGTFPVLRVRPGTVKTVPYHYYSFSDRKLSLSKGHISGPLPNGLESSRYGAHPQDRLCSLSSTAVFVHCLFISSVRALSSSFTAFSASSNELPFTPQ